MEAEVSQIIYRWPCLLLLLLRQINTVFDDDNTAVMFLTCVQPEAETSGFCPSAVILGSEDSDEGDHQDMF